LKGREAILFDVQRQIGILYDEARISRRVEVGPALSCRHRRLLRVEKDHGEGEAALRDRNGGRPDGDGGTLGEVERPEVRRRDSELHDPDVRSEQGDG